jgi:hypothetical protein
MSEIVLIGLGVIVVFLLAVNNRRATKRHIVMITLAIFVYLSSCAAVETEPCFSERPLFSSGQMSVEFADGFTEVVKSGSEIIVNVFWPVYGDWVNLFQFSVKCIGELFRGGTERDESLNLKSAKDTEQSGNDGERPCGKLCQIIHAFFPGLILVFIPLILSHIATFIKLITHSLRFYALDRGTINQKWSNSDFLKGLITYKYEIRSG